MPGDRQTNPLRNEHLAITWDMLLGAELGIIIRYEEVFFCIVEEKHDANFSLFRKVFLQHFVCLPEVHFSSAQKSSPFFLFLNLKSFLFRSYLPRHLFLLIFLFSFQPVIFISTYLPSILPLAFFDLLIFLFISFSYLLFFLILFFCLPTFFF